MGATDKRRFERFDFDGTAMLVFTDHEFRGRWPLQIIAISPKAVPASCRPMSTTSGSVIVVELEMGRLHLKLAGEQRMADFEIAALTKRFDVRFDVRPARSHHFTRRWSDQ